MVEKKMDDMDMRGHWKMHKKMMGCKMLVIGALVLANNYWNIVSWTNFIGGILVLAGICTLLMPSKCCKK